MLRTLTQLYDLFLETFGVFSHFQLGSLRIEFGLVSGFIILNATGRLTYAYTHIDTVSKGKIVLVGSIASCLFVPSQVLY